MRKKYFVTCLFVIKLFIEVFGSLYYDQTPQVVWSIGNAILIMVPLAFGIRAGLLCFLPVLVCEIVWFFHLRAVGPLLHLFSFAVAVVLLGLAGEKLKNLPTHQRVIGSSILFELSLLGEEALYRALMMLFSHRHVTWNNISGTFLSLANPLLLLLLVFCCLSDRGAQGTVLCVDKEREE